MKSDMMTKLQQQSKDEFSHRDRAVLGDVGDWNAALPGGGNVHAVVSSGRYRNKA